ncbi:MAG: tetratricopeptide repeat protein [Deltaproteobacteria bacterium]|nr:tetratricopeptide repeat protein [Deltaproteobacteria bacterium]
MEEKRQPQPDKKENKFVISPEIERHMQILRKDPKSPVFAILSEAYRKGGLLDEAIATAVEGLKFNPNYISGRVALGRAYFDKGEMDKAIEELKKVIKSTPDNIISHKLIADIYIKKSDASSALQELKTILYLSPDDKEAKTLMASLSKPLPAEEKKTQTAEPPVPEQQAERPVEQPQEPLPQEHKETPAVPQYVEEHGTPEVEHPPEAGPAEPGQRVGEQGHGPAEEPPVVARTTETEPELKVTTEPQNEVIQSPEIDQQKPGEEPAAGAAGNVPSIDSELENALNNPINESNTDEVPVKPEQNIIETEVPGTAAHETDQKTVFAETRADEQAGVKEEELEAVFEDLAQTAETPSQQQSAPYQPQQREEEPQPSGVEHIQTQEIDENEIASPRTDAPEPASPLQEQASLENQKTSELHGEDIQTVTMADLYIKQGHLDKAYHIYRTILLKAPDSPVIRAKLVKVKKLMESKQQEELDKKKLEALREREPKPAVITEQSDSMKDNMKRLNAWLEKIKKGG